MASGLVFSIEEFALFDGPGIRTAVFLKGCPLRCAWCHNPEGLNPNKQVVRGPNGCTGCGSCKAVCTNAQCIGCGKCTYACPNGLIRMSGGLWEAKDLAAHIMKNAKMLINSGGGVTLSGGEVLMQAVFAKELLDNLEPLHRAIETSGCGDSAAFLSLIKSAELVYFDLKHMDSDMHKKYTGVGNEKILANAKLLIDSAVPFIVRIPLISGVNDDTANISETAAFLRGAKNLQRLELLPYNSIAGAKYAMLGMEYGGDFTPPDQSKLDEIAAIFATYGIDAIVQ